MRIDKYLWCVRLFKTRSLATEMIRAEKLWVDDVPVKPSREVKLGERFTLKQHGYMQVFEVKALPKSRVSAKIVADFLIDITPSAEYEKRDFLQLAKKTSRQPGLGRPTKKERRALDSLDDF